MGRAGTIFDGRSRKGTASTGCGLLLIMIIGGIAGVHELIKRGNISGAILIIVIVIVGCIMVYFKQDGP